MSASRPPNRPPLSPTHPGSPQLAGKKEQSRPSLERKAASISPRQDQPDATSPGTPRPGYDGSSESSEDMSKEETKSPLPVGSPDEETLRKLREEMHAKLAYNQQRTRLAQSRSNSGNLSARRVSPIKEEPSSAMSPSLEASFRSPLPTGQTTSTESTESSSRTIRGSIPPTPSQASLRTPSYPFPYIPGSPQMWSSSFHRPFTTLSPTVSSMHVPKSQEPEDEPSSEASTPAASVSTFIPGPLKEDPEFPSPNLYELILQLNSSEPGLDGWWATLCRLLYEFYGAERSSLALPADAGELFNVPWGQKATFNITGPPSNNPMLQRFELPTRSKEQKPSAAPLRNVYDDSDPGSTSSSSSGRPRMLSRHSYAGYERKTDSGVSSSPTSSHRPNMPRSTSYAPHTISFIEEEFDGKAERGLPKTYPFHQASTKERTNSASFSDPEFSSAGSEQPSGIGPYHRVLLMLRALNFEDHALLDDAGVNRIIERGKLVTLTRDYSTEGSRKDSATLQQRSEKKSSTTKHPPRQTQPPTMKLSDAQSIAGKRLGLATDYLNRMKTQPAYEEYEQLPSSPWAQSPAPSPAIQADPEENPFFAPSGGNVDEESFEPSESSQDYAQFENVEAIGVDKASTVIHLPLVHPVMSQVLPSRARDDQSDRGSDTPTTGRPSSKLSMGTEEATPGDMSPRRAPLAILSFLCPIVPYPPNLIQSLKLLAPHMATSFSIAQQYSNVHRQAAESLLQRTTGHRVGFAPLGDTGLLQDLIDADLDTFNQSMTSSITSPSDYSGRSRPSPGGSLVGTPAWDPSTIGYSSRHSVGSTPGAASSEAIDSYFDAKNRSPVSKNENQGQLAPMQRVTGRESPAPDTRQLSAKLPLSEEGKTAKAERRSSRDRTSSSSYHNRTGSEKRKTVTTQLPEVHQHKQHTLLHSYGADFASTFQSLPSAATPAARGPGPGQSGAQYPQGEEAMPPPSERLLRTIIDSLPVQIFTAAPETGELTWVNSKFLVYRGQEPQHILNNPWQAIHPEDREVYMEQWKKSLSTGQQFSHKVRLQRFDNDYRWFYVRATPLKDRRQKIVHWTGTYMDIHEQHIAEANAARQQETAASEAKYRALANSSPQIVFAVNRTKGVIFCNTQWPSYSGQTEAQALGLGFMEYVHPDDLSKCRLPKLNEDGSPADDVPLSLPPEVPQQDSRSSSDDSSETSRTVTSPGVQSPAAVAMPQAKLSRLASQGILKISKDADGRPSYSTEVRLRSKDGQYRWHLVRVLLSEAVRKDGTEDETWYGTCTDINDHKVLEQTLKDTMDAKSRFLSNMSHEIRTPLNGITGMVNFLIDSNLSSEQMEHVSIIRSSTEGLRDLINDILDLSKVEAGMITLQMEWMHVRSLIEEVNDLASALAIDKGLELNYLVATDVPSMVKGDRFRIRQVLLNVVGNAIKFTQTGEVFVKCHLDQPPKGTLKSDETMLKFEVMDTGPGFSEEEAQYLFKRFSQIDSSSTKAHSGTGLGLAISMQLVELHGGTMWAHSERGEGSTFYFTAKFNVPSIKDQSSIPASTPGALELQPPGVMAVEPEPSKDSTKFPSPFQQGLPRKDSDSPSVAASSPLRTQQSSAASSGSSDPSIRSSHTSMSNLSVVSPVPETVFKPASPAIQLELPTLPREDSSSTQTSSTATPGSAPLTGLPISASPSPRPRSPLQPSMYSILVVCPLEHARGATVSHIDLTIPKSAPHHITSRARFEDCLPLFNGDDPVIFTHVVLVLRDVQGIISFMDRVFRSSSYFATSIVIITDLVQRRDIMTKAPSYDYEALQKDRRLRFVFKPSKPSKFAVIFDPQKERELSSDRNQDSAQAVAVSQKQVFDEMKRRLGEKGFRVLLVEDNKTNQMVLLKFLNRVSITVETALDGVQCTDKVFGNFHGYYSIILVGLLPFQFWIVESNGYTLVRSPHAQQRWLSNVQRHPQVGTR